MIYISSSFCLKDATVKSPSTGGYNPPHHGIQTQDGVMSVTSTVISQELIYQVAYEANSERPSLCLKTGL